MSASPAGRFRITTEYLIASDRIGPASLGSRFFVFAAASGQLSECSPVSGSSGWTRL